MPLNVEIKARTSRQDEIRTWLERAGADFRGVDHQIDTYFQVPKGRLKLREGNIEQHLIHYDRPNQAGPKVSQVSLYRPAITPDLKAVLLASLGIWKVVDKHRSIYFLENVKFHLDQVEGLGAFVEIEAIDKDGSLGQAHLLEQCQTYMTHFEIPETDLLEGSYSDMLG